MQPAPPTPPFSNPAMARIETRLQDRGLALLPALTPPPGAHGRGAVHMTERPFDIPAAIAGEAERVA